MSRAVWSAVIAAHPVSQGPASLSAEVGSVSAVTGTSFETTHCAAAAAPTDRGRRAFHTEVHSDPRLYTHAPHVLGTPETNAAFFEAILAHWAEHDFGYWVAEDAQSGMPVGWVGVQRRGAYLNLYYRFVERGARPGTGAGGVPGLGGDGHRVATRTPRAGPGEGSQHRLRAHGAGSRAGPHRRAARAARRHPGGAAFVGLRGAAGGPARGARRRRADRGPRPVVPGQRRGGFGRVPAGRPA